jgi:hypothetical protein
MAKGVHSDRLLCDFQYLIGLRFFTFSIKYSTA